MGEKNPYDRNQYRSDAEYGLEDARWTFWKGFRLVFVIAVILGILGYFMGWFIQWPREDREQFNLWEQEVAGIKASYNMLAADYNAQMAKFNWAFAERGKLPEGATDPLPREYKPYEEK